MFSWIVPANLLRDGAMRRPQKFVDSPVLEEIKNDVTPELLALFDDDPDLDNYPDDVVCDIVKHVKAWKRKNSESLTWVSISSVRFATSQSHAGRRRIRLLALSTGA